MGKKYLENRIEFIFIFVWKNILAEKIQMGDKNILNITVMVI